MALFAKNKKLRDWGNIVLGFGILFFGINTMTDSVEPLKDSPEFIYLLTTYGKNQWIGLFISAALTGVLQSSGAIIGLIQALALSGVFAGTSRNRSDSDLHPDYHRLQYRDLRHLAVLDPAHPPRPRTPR